MLIWIQKQKSLPVSRMLKFTYVFVSTQRSSCLALLDSLNPATIVAITLIPLAAPRRAGITVLACAFGVMLTVFTVGAALFLAAGAATDAVDSILFALRFIAFGIAGTTLTVAGFRRFKDGERKGISLPSWFTPLIALPFGVVVTAGDLPNAFPYFIAIERMLDGGIDSGLGLLIILGYSFIYCLPCLILITIAAFTRERTRAWLSGIVTRLSSGAIKKSVPDAILPICLGIGAASIPFGSGN